MPRFTPNLSNVSAGIPLLDRGEYEFLVGESKPFIRVTEKDGVAKTLWGVVTSLKVTSEGAFKDKTIPWQMFMHTDASQPMIKQFLMAVYGFNKNNEADFNVKFNEDDYIVDTEDNILGDVWTGIAGKYVRANVVQKANKLDATQMQNQFSWFPF